MALYDVTAFGSSLEFDTSFYQFGSCVQIDATHFINFWAGVDSDGYVQVFEVNTSTGAVTKKGTALEFDTTNGAHNSCAQIDDTHFINFWSGADDDGFVQVFTVNTSTWAVTAEGSALEFDTVLGFYNSCCQIDETHYLNFWAGSGDDGFVQVFTVDTDDWAVTAEGSALEFDTADCSYNSCYQIDGTHFINFWAGVGDDGFVQVFTVDTDDWAVTKEGTALEFDTGFCAYNSCAQIDGTHFINFWDGTDYDGFAQVFTVNTSTWAVTKEGTALEFDTAIAFYNSCAQIDDTHFINFWAGWGYDGYVQVFTVNTSTWAVTAEGSALEFDTSKAEYNSCCEISKGKFINFWSWHDSNGYVRTFSVEMPAGLGNPVMIWG
jgi:hypothetical protein